jgi:hypothetical protein
LSNPKALFNSDWFKSKSKPLVTAKFAVVKKSREFVKSACFAQVIQMSLKQESLLNSSLPYVVLSSVEGMKQKAFPREF